MYKLESVVWEITVGCNLRCRHCGSACTEGQADELNTEEGLDLIDDIMRLKPSEITLTGGEPFLRKDWYVLAKRISEYNVKLRIITNGTCVTPDVVRLLADANVEVVGVSLDGTCELHNNIRNTNCYNQCFKALTLLKEAGISTSVNTTVMKNNISILPQIKKELQNAGVKAWQIQPGIASGRLAEHRDWMIVPDDMEKLIDYAYDENLKDENLKIFLPDTVGYYSNKEMLSRKIACGSNEYPVWSGCNAGIRSVGILSNGDVIGCLSIRDQSFIEGNVRNRSIFDIWNDKDSFAWRRQLTPKKLSGHCQSCKYAHLCLGGCTNMRLCTQGTIYSSNEFCIYHVKTRNNSDKNQI